MESVPGPEVIKLFSCSAQLRLKFILFINVKMPLIVGILTFTRRTNFQFLRFELEFSTTFDLDQLANLHSDTLRDLAPLPSNGIPMEIFRLLLTISAFMRGRLKFHAQLR